MLRHEHYQEICAVASIGQATGQELAELNEHLTVCPECRHRYSDFMAMQASQYASRTDEPQIDATETLGCIDSPLLRKRFMERAESEGITFSPIEAEEPERLPSRPAGRPHWLSLQLAMAVLLVTFGTLLGRFIVNGRLPRVPTSDSHLNAQLVTPKEVQDLMAKVSELQTENRGLTTDLNTARTNFVRLSSRLNEVEASSTKSDEDRLHLSSAMREREETIASLEDQLNQAKAGAAELRADLEKAAATSTENQNALVESRIRVQELTEQLADESKALDQEKEMLTAGRDIRELMAARNLHIVDVFDTDPKGKDRPAFGRIFLTEG